MILRYDLSRGSVVFIGTATVLIRYAGFTVLADSNVLHRGELVIWVWAAVAAIDESGVISVWQNDRQRAWLKTRIKTASPMSLLFS